MTWVSPVSDAKSPPKPTWACVKTKWKTQHCGLVLDFQLKPARRARHARPRRTLSRPICLNHLRHGHLLVLVDRPVLREVPSGFILYHGTWPNSAFLNQPCTCHSGIRSVRPHPLDATPKPPPKHWFIVVPFPTQTLYAQHSPSPVYRGGSSVLGFVK